MSKSAQFTLLHRDEGWSQFDMERLWGGLSAGVRAHPKYPKHLILDGHYTEEEVQATLPDKGFSVRNIVGNHNLPFCPPS